MHYCLAACYSFTLHLMRMRLILVTGAEDQILEELRSSSHYSVDMEKMFVTMVQSSGKLVLIDKLLPKLKADGHKVLVFSQMIRVLDIIEDYIIHKKFVYLNFSSLVQVL